MKRLLYRMGENAEHFLRQVVFGNAVMIIKPRLRPPADVEGRINVGLRPLEHLTKLRPVVHLFKGHLLHRCAGNDQPVKPLTLHVVKGLIIPEQVIVVRISGNVRSHLKQLQIDLQRRIGQQPQHLRLRLHLLRHQVQNSDFQRTDILMIRPLLVHDENVFPLQDGVGRQRSRYLNGHTLPSLSSLDPFYHITIRRSLQGLVHRQQTAYFASSSSASCMASAS